MPGQVSAGPTNCVASIRHSGLFSGTFRGALASTRVSREEMRPFLESYFNLLGMKGCKPLHCDCTHTRTSHAAVIGSQPLITAVTGTQDLQNSVKVPLPRNEKMQKQSAMRSVALPKGTRKFLFVWFILCGRVVAKHYLFISCFLVWKIGLKSLNTLDMFRLLNPYM